VPISPSLDETDQDIDLGGMTHIVCLCTPEISLCGRKMPDSALLDLEENEVECVVCAELDGEPCPKCEDA
jgi:hypothetical protein